MAYLLALDAGTTSVRAMLYDLKQKKFIYQAQQPVEQFFPQSGWVEQNAGEIYNKALYVLTQCIKFAGPERVEGIGIANQRETVVLWDKKKGDAIAPAIVWQCRRTSSRCDMISEDMRAKIRQKTGLRVDPYFSATKIEWLLKNTPKARELLTSGHLCAGTIDSYLIFRFTGKFLTDHTNASRTMLFNIHTLNWDEELCRYFGVPREILPEPRPSASHFGEAVLCGKQFPITAVIGDQQASLFGQACLEKGEGKITYGTGLFLLINLGSSCIQSKSGLITTVAYTVGNKTVYALEGSSFHAGSGIQWLRDGIQILNSSEESETLAESVPDTNGVFFVPAFTGLGAPHWDSEARGLLCGITLGCKRAHIVRAVLESIAFSARELCECVRSDSGICLNKLKCDGGVSANRFLMQFQADVLNLCLDLPEERESTALGAAYLAAVSLGIYDENEIKALQKTKVRYLPSQDREPAEKGYQSYLEAVKRALKRQ